MKKILITLAATAATLAAAAPATAQSWGNVAQRGYGYGYPGDRGLVNRYQQQIRQLDQRIERSAQRRAISPGEYRSLRNQSADLRRALHNFARNGLDRGEIRSLDQRILNLQQRIRDERRDGRRGW